MLNDISQFFGDVTPQGAVALLGLGFFTGMGMRDCVSHLWCLLYGGNHDDDN